MNGRIFFGDLVCKWWAYFRKFALQLQQLKAAGDPEVVRLLQLLPSELLLTPEKLEQMVPATSAVHSNTHVWDCQV